MVGGVQFPTHPTERLGYGDFVSNHRCDLVARRTHLPFFTIRTPSSRTDVLGLDRLTKDKGIAQTVRHIIFSQYRLCFLYQLRFASMVDIGLNMRMDTVRALS